MNYSNMPKVNHKILVWTRETAGFDLEQAAAKLGIKSSKDASAQQTLAAYEEGKRNPSRSMLLNMARVYRRPLLTFYLNQPPHIGDRGQDFRTLPNRSEPDNVYVDTLIRNVKARQSLLRAALIEEGETSKLTFVGSITTKQTIQQAVAALQTALTLDLNKFRSRPDHKNAFKLLRQQVEAAGIFVLLQGDLGSHHTNIDVRLFRGFALSDDIAPFIVINDRDAPAAWSFTLLHEIVHILLGQTGVSGGDYAEQQIEKFCNDVASEFLLSKQEFEDFIVTAMSGDELYEQISQYAFKHKLSNSHIAYRLYKRGDINKQQWQDACEFYQEQWLKQRKQKKEERSNRGPHPDKVKKYKLGNLIPLAQRLNNSGILSTTKTATLLNAKPLKVHNLFEVGQAA